MSLRICLRLGFVYWVIILWVLYCPVHGAYTCTYGLWFLWILYGAIGVFQVVGTVYAVALREGGLLLAQRGNFFIALYAVSSL